MGKSNGCAVLAGELGVCCRVAWSIWDGECEYFDPCMVPACEIEERIILGELESVGRTIPVLGDGEANILFEVVDDDLMTTAAR